MTMEIRPLEPDDAQAALDLRVAAFSTSMHVDLDDNDVYAPDDLRLVAVDDGRVVGHLAVWPFAQSFRGRAVPMGGVGGVVVAIDQRGRGIGSRLLAASLDLMARRDMPISSLYPSTPAPYRAWGWEVAGEHVRRTIPTRELLELPPAPGEISLRPFEQDDLDDVLALHNAVTRNEPGGLQLPRVWFERLLTPDPDDPELSIVAMRDGVVVGLLLAAKVSGTGPNDGFGLHVIHLFGSDGGVEVALWRNVASHYSVASTTTFNSQPADPLQFLLPTALPVVTPSSHLWMTRLVDAPAAVAARGWPDVQASCPLTIVDPRRPDNDGHWVLEVDAGEGRLEPAPSSHRNARPTTDIGALSSMYTGFATPLALARAGRLTGAGHGHLKALVELFVGPSPFLRDYF